MFWFTVTFVPLMIVLPALIALLVRTPRDVEVDRADLRRRLNRLLFATAGSLVIFAAVYLTLGEPVARFTWPLFFPLFFVFAMPVMVLKNPGWKSPQPTTTSVRAASLTSRYRRNPIHWSLWLVGWAVLVASIVGVLGRLAVPFEDRQFTNWLVTIIILPITGSIGLILGPICVRMVMQEPEPMDEQGSPRLARAYERYRNRRAWAFYLGSMVMTVIMSLAIAAVAWMPESRTLAWIGAIVGTSIGLAGGVIGTLFSFERVRISNLLRELSDKKADGQLGIEH